MGTPHKYAEVIKAWADGVEIQFRYRANTIWHRTEQPSFSVDYEWRVKPEPNKYRVALCKSLEDRNSYTYTAQNELEANFLATQPYFVRWLADWVDYENE